MYRIESVNSVFAFKLGLSRLYEIRYSALKVHRVTKKFDEVMNGDSGIREGVPMRTNTAKRNPRDRIAAHARCRCHDGRGASFEGLAQSAASAEQLAMHADDPWLSK